MSDLVSILMPAYRAAAFIERAVRSVLQQTYPHWELLVVADDGEDYRSLLRERGLEDGRLRFLSTRRIAAGPNRARNIALRAARGRFIAPLDADDFYYPERLQTLLPLARIFAVAADNVDVCDSGSSQLLYRPFTVSSQVAALPLGSLFALSTPLLLLFDRRLLRCHWNERVVLGEDTLFNLRIVEAAGQLVCHHTPLHAYCVHGQSICHSAGAAGRAERAYRYCLQHIDGDGLGFRTQGFRHSVRRMLERKYRLNQRYAARVAGGFSGSFQDFIAAQEAGLNDYELAN